MRRFSVLLMLLVLLPGAAQAAKKVPTIQPLLDAIPETEEPDKMLKRASRATEACVTQDGNWKRAQENRVPISNLYELLGSAVVCWQGAEKKAAKAGAAAGPLQWWVTARRGYIEAYRSYLWAIDAKLSSDRSHVCKRLKTAVSDVGGASESSEGLMDKYEAADARALGGQLAADIKGLAETIAAEHANQKCQS